MKWNRKFKTGITVAAFIAIPTFILFAIPCGLSFYSYSSSNLGGGEIEEIRHGIVRFRDATTWRVPRNFRRTLQVGDRLERASEGLVYVHNGTRVNGHTAILSEATRTGLYGSGAGIVFFVMAMAITKIRERTES